MSVKWKWAVARHACLVATALMTSRAGAEDFTFLVNGVLLLGSTYDRSQTRIVGLYAEKSGDRKDGSELAKSETNPDGTFTLRTQRGSRRLREKHLWVVDLPKGDLVCGPHLLEGADYRVKDNNVTVANVKLDCTPKTGAAPAEMAHALAALAETHEVLAWAGVQTLDAGDVALKDAVASTAGDFNADERAAFTTAFQVASARLRKGSGTGLQLLPSFKRADFAEELVAAAPGWRWQRRLETPKEERPDERVLAYSERGGRFEGDVVKRVGSTFDEFLVSLSEGPLSIDPENDGSVQLAWPAVAGARVCLEASATVPGFLWKMRKASNAGSTSFTWDLSVARTTGLKKDEIGVVARNCTDADRDQRTFVPVRVGATPGQRAAAYRIVFLFPRQLTTIHLAVFQGEDASRRDIALGENPVTFDTAAQAPLVTIDVPKQDLVPGLVHIELSGRGPGGFGPERFSFVQFERSGR